MKVYDALAPLDPEVLRHIPKRIGNVEIGITMPGAVDSANPVNASSAVGTNGENMLLLELPAKSLEVLVPAPLAHESWWRQWWDKLMDED